MAKSKKDKASKALSGGNLFSQEAVSSVVSYLSKFPDNDEVLRKAGVSRHRLKVLLEDDEIGQAAETRQDALLATPFRIEPSDTPQAELLKQELEEWFYEIVAGAHNALFSGYSVQEAVYQQNETHIGLSWIGEKPMQWFEPKNDGRLILRSDGTGVESQVDQVFKFFLTRRKATYEQPYGKALLSSLYWLHFFKQNGFKFWAKFLERFGTPILLGKVSEAGDNNENIQAMNDALLSAHAQSVISIDIDDDVQILGSGSGNAGASFEIFDQTIKRQIQKLILGQTLTSGTDNSGSRALGEVHENVRKDKLKSDIRLVTPTVQAVVNALCDINDWERHKIIIGEEQKSLNKEQAERDAILSKDMGVRFSSGYITKNYGFEDGDIVEVGTQDAPQTKFTALPKTAFSFKADVQKVDPQQREVDSMVDSINKKLFSESELLKVVESSKDTNDLQDKLYGLMASESVEKFNATMARALYLFDVVGYVQRSG